MDAGTVVAVQTVDTFEEFICAIGPSDLKSLDASVFFTLESLFAKVVRQVTALLSERQPFHAYTFFTNSIFICTFIEWGGAISSTEWHFINTRFAFAYSTSDTHVEFFGTVGLSQ